jgi:hypothetical protein
LPLRRRSTVGLLPCCGRCAHVPTLNPLDHSLHLYPLPTSLSFLISLCSSTSAQGPLPVTGPPKPKLTRTYVAAADPPRPSVALCFPARSRVPLHEVTVCRHYLLRLQHKIATSCSMPATMAPPTPPAAARSTTRRSRVGGLHWLSRIRSSATPASPCVGEPPPHSPDCPLHLCRGETTGCIHEIEDNVGGLNAAAKGIDGEQQCHLV